MILTLSTALFVPGAPLPTEFRIFHYGINPTENGYDVLFDERAAKSIAARLAKWGADIMVDLEHKSLLDPASPGHDPDARGWLKLEVRKDEQGRPELWATNVRWTSDGERRLTEGTQRYPSPAFRLDADKRVIEIFNVALVAMPGLDHCEPLAASRTTPMKKLSLLSALTLATLAATLHKAGAEPEAIVKTLAAEDGGGDGDAASPATIKALAEIFGIAIDPAEDPAGYVKGLVANLDEVRAKLTGDSSGGDVGELPPTDMAAAREVARLCGKATLIESIATLSEWRQLALEDETRRKKILEDERKLEATRYRQMAARLVICGAELPSTAWEDEGRTIPAKHLRAQTLEQLESRATSFESLRGSNANNATAHRPAGGKTEQTSRIQALARDMKIDEAKAREICARVDARNEARRRMAAGEEV